MTDTIATLATQPTWPSPRLCATASLLEESALQLRYGLATALHATNCCLYRRRRQVQCRLSEALLELIDSLFLVLCAFLLGLLQSSLRVP